MTWAMEIGLKLILCPQFSDRRHKFGGCSKEKRNKKRKVNWKKNWKNSSIHGDTLTHEAPQQGMGHL
jgi:hypothetical protein